jgi:GH25 family lysozyme M1 (1,4-beta-N-acetylmuramidase)
VPGRAIMKLRRVRRGFAAVALGIALVALCPDAAPAGKRFLGIDISRFDGAINWTRVADSRVKFAFIEASRGSGADCAVKPKRCGADPFYDLNYWSARAAGIRVGAYHRAFPTGNGWRELKSDARAEARIFAEQVDELFKDDLLPALDFESPFGGLDARQLRSWVHIWLERVRKELGQKPIVYTNVTSWRATGDTTELARAGTPLWVANWGVDSPAVPADDWDGRGWSIWQFTNSGSVRGIKGRVDEDWLRGGFGRVSAR